MTARTMTIPGIGVHPRPLRDRIRAQYAPGMHALTRALPEPACARLETDVRVAAGLTAYEHLGDLVVVECQDTGWVGVACTLGPIVPGAAA